MPSFSRLGARPAITSFRAATPGRGKIAVLAASPDVEVKIGIVVRIIRRERLVLRRLHEAWLTGHYPGWKRPCRAAGADDWVRITPSPITSGRLVFFGGSPWTTQYATSGASSRRLLRATRDCSDSGHGDAGDPNVPLVNSYDGTTRCAMRASRSGVYAYPVDTHFPKDIVDDGGVGSG